MGYEERVALLLQKYSLGEQIIGEQAKKDLLSPRDFQNYIGTYADLYEEFKGTEKEDTESIKDDLIFEMELVKQVEVNIDYQCI